MPYFSLGLDGKVIFIPKKSFQVVINCNKSYLLQVSEMIYTCYMYLKTGEANYTFCLTAMSFLLKQFLHTVTLIKFSPLFTKQSVSWAIDLKH